MCSSMYAMSAITAHLKDDALSAALQGYPTLITVENAHYKKKM